MHYRFYRLSEDNRIDSAIDHDFPDDAAAFSFALTIVTDKSIEAWQSERIVFRVAPAEHERLSGP